MTIAKDEYENVNIRELEATLKRMEKEGKLSDYHNQLLKWTKNVDQNYAWVILIASFFLMGSVLGPYRLYGLMFATVTETGVYTREEASWPVTLVFGVENLLGPLVSIVVYFISHRKSLLMGALLAVLGNGLASLSRTLWLDVLLIGVVQGIGYAFIFTPYMEILNGYFVKYRNLALGLSLSGGTISTIFLGPIFQWILQNYPWRYGYIGTFGVTCTCIFLAPLLKPNVRPKPESDINAKKMNDRNTFARLSFKALSFRNSIRSHSTIVIKRSNGIGNQMTSQRQASVVSMNPFASTAGLERKISRSLTDDKIRASTKKMPESLKKQFSVASVDRYEAMSLSEMGEDESDFSSSLILDVIKTPGFHLIWFNELLYFWVFTIFCLVMVDYAVDRGCTKSQAESLLNFHSMGELFGRIVLTSLIDLKFMSNKNAVISVLLIISTLFAVVTQLNGFIAMASITFGVFAFAALLYILINGLLVDYLGERQVTMGYGMASCIAGLLMIFRPMAVGYCRDTLGTYDPLMMGISMAAAFGAVLWMIEPIISRKFCPAPKEISGESTTMDTIA